MKWQNWYNLNITKKFLTKHNKKTNWVKSMSV